MSESVLNNYAQLYVNLVLNKSRYDLWDVNWYTEGPFWRRTTMQFSRTYKIIPDYEVGEQRHGKSLTDIIGDSAQLERDLASYAASAPKEEQRRAQYLLEHTHQLNVRARLLAGERMGYDEMTRELYCLVAPKQDESVFAQALADMGAALPGSGSAGEKIMRFRQSIRIPRENLLKVCKAVAQTFHDMSCQNMETSVNNMPRIRVRELPGSMQFLSILFGYDYDRIEYERNFNLNYPWTVDNLVECIAHECEPGHLVYFEKRTKAFIDTGWPEMGMVSQHTSSNAFSEGAARHAITMCFDNDLEKMREYEREVVFGGAGLDKGLAEVMPQWHRFCEMAGYAKLEATRNLWDGVWTKEQAGAFLERFSFNDLGTGVETIDRAPDDAGHFAAHDYARDVVRAYFKEAAPTIAEQWKLYEDLCSDDFPMSGIVDRTYRPEPSGIW